jgi:hypothetical protein
MKQTNERSKLVAELEMAETELGQSTAELELQEQRRKSAQGSDHDWGFSTGRLQELREILPGLRSRADVIVDRIKAIDAEDAYRRKIQEAPRQAQACREAWLGAAEKAAILTTSADKLRARVAALEVENADAAQQAESAESDAAGIYAAAIGGGDEAAEKAASERLKKVQAASATARAKAASASILIDALRGELASLEARRQEAEDEAREHRRETFEAITTCLRAKWDVQADALIAIGTRLAAASRRTDVPAGLYGLELPRFEPDCSPHRERNLVGDWDDDTLLGEILGVSRE